MFGRRKVRPAALQPTSAHDGSDGRGDGSGSKFPWPTDRSYVACNLAGGNIANNLAARLTVDGRVHAETYVAAAGALAGFAAQQSLMHQLGPETTAQLQIVSTANGRRFIFGEPIAQMLLAQNDDSNNGRVWPVVCGAAVAAGLPIPQLPDLGSMFRHVAASIGGPGEGLPSVDPKHHPHMAGLDLLRVVWPFALQFFNADFDDLHRRHGAVPVTSWGAIAAYICGRPIGDVKDALQPDIAATILMETAIYCSKLPPVTLHGV
jgi:hypothetical protein